MYYHVGRALYTIFGNRPRKYVVRSLESYLPNHLLLTTGALLNQNVAGKDAGHLYGHWGKWISGTAYRPAISRQRRHCFGLRHCRTV